MKPLVIELFNGDFSQEGLRLILKGDEAKTMLQQPLEQAVELALRDPSLEGDGSIQSALMKTVQQDPDFAMQTSKQMIAPRMLRYYADIRAVIPRPTVLLASVTEQGTVQKDVSIDYAGLAIHHHLRPWEGFTLFSKNPFAGYDFPFITASEDRFVPEGIDEAALIEDEKLLLFDKFLGLLSDVIYYHDYPEEKVEQIKTVLERRDQENFRDVFYGAVGSHHFYHPIDENAAPELVGWQKHVQFRRYLAHEHSMDSVFGSRIEDRPDSFIGRNGDFAYQRTLKNLAQVAQGAHLTRETIRSNQNQSWRQEFNWMFGQQGIYQDGPVNCTKDVYAQEFLNLLDTFIFSEEMANTSGLELDPDDICLDAVVDVNARNLMQNYTAYVGAMRHAVDASYDSLNFTCLDHRAEISRKES